MIYGKQIYTLRERREALGFTQQRLASPLGLTRESISQYETGKATPSAAIMFALAHIFECTVDELFGHKFPNQDQAA